MAEHITCQELVELVTAYLEGSLDPHETALFEQHVNFCEGCDEYVDQMRIVIATTGRIEESHVPSPIRERLLAAFRERHRS
ncbi:MAG TPA: zf-HC2 domain-containing protein [Solirubrobacter sp.]|nr:zf-HC2 domain-containing protein [Solirubrobacter sp.]